MKDETCSGHPMQENLALEERKMDHGRNGFWRLAEKSDLALKSQRGLFPSTITCHYLIKMTVRHGLLVISAYQATPRLVVAPPIADEKALYVYAIRMTVDANDEMCCEYQCNPDFNCAMQKVWIARFNIWATYIP
ncbi:unnamed protein product [Camellia sinensis]